MVKLQKDMKRMLLFLFAALILTIAAGPVIMAGSHTVRAEALDETEGEQPTVEEPAKKGKTRFVQKNGRWFYYKNGRKQTGWIRVGKRVYFGKKYGKDKGMLLEGWVKKNGKWYYFRETGKKKVRCSMCKNGTYKINGISCVFRADGSFKKFKHAGSTNSFVGKVGEMAREMQAKHNILASLIVAQACLETGYGAHIYRNNLFGIRQGSGYRSYKNWRSSVKDYVSFMQQYIPRIFGVRNWYSACSIVGGSGYAQAGNYGSMLISITSSQNLTRFNR